MKLVQFLKFEIKKDYPCSQIIYNLKTKSRRLLFRKQSVPYCPVLSAGIRYYSRGQVVIYLLCSILACLAHVTVQHGRLSGFPGLGPPLSLGLLWGLRLPTCVIQRNLTTPVMTSHGSLWMGSEVADEELLVSALEESDGVRSKGLILR
jgi:hypothetical protein